MEKILNWLKERDLKAKIQPNNLWRDHQDVFNAFNLGTKEQYLLKMIQEDEEEEQRIFLKGSSLVINTEEFYYPTVDQIYIEDKKVIAVLFKSKGKSLASFMLQKKEILSPARAAKFCLELINFQRIFQMKKWHIADQIPNSLLFEQRDQLKILPLLVSDKDFKKHVFNRYVHAAAGGDVFPYPPETLYSALDLETESVERGEAQDVWAIGVMLFIFLGGSKITLLKLADYTKRSEGLQELEGFPLCPVFKRIFESSTTRRISLKELEKQLLVISRYTKQMVSEAEKLEAEVVGEEQKAIQIDEQDEIAGNYKIIIESNTIEALFNKGRLYLQLKKYDEGIQILEECLTKIESMGSNKRLTINKEQVYRKLGKICMESNKTSKKIESWLSQLEVEKNKRDLEKIEKKKIKKSKEQKRNDNASTYVADVELLLEEIKSGTLYDWKTIWDHYIKDMLPQSLPRSEKISLFLVIKACLDQITAEFQTASEETKPVQSILNGEVKETYKRSLLDLNYKSIGRFLFSASALAKELENDTLSMELSRARAEIAKALADAGKQEIATEYLQEIQKSECSNIMSLQLLGEHELSMNNLKGAMKCAQKILQSDPMNITANLLMAKCTWSQKDTKSTKSYLSKCLCIDPQLNEARLILIEVYLTEKNLHEVLKELNLCLEKNPSQASLYLDLGKTCSQLGMYEDSKSNYEKFLEFDPRHASAFFDLGQVLEKLNNIDAAAVEYQKEISVNPSLLESYFELAQIQEKRGEVQESIMTLENGVNANPESELAMEKLMDSLERQNETKKLQIAIESYGRITIDIIGSSAFMTSAKAVLQKGSKENSVSYFNQALKRWPKSADLKFNVANLYFKNNFNIPEAVSLVEEAVNMVPQMHQYLFLLAKMYILQEKQSEAYESLLSLVESAPDHASALCELGKLQLFYKKDYPSALKTLKRSIRLSDKSPGIYSALGVAYYKIDQIKYSIPCLELSRKSEEQDDRIELVYGKALYFDDQWTQAIVVLQKLLGKKGFSKRPEMLFYLGLCNKELGKKAISFLSQSATVLTNRKLKLVALKMSLNILINDRDSSDIIRFMQKIKTQIDKENDPDLCAYLCEAQLICESDPLLAMHFIEQGLQAHLFSENEKDDQPKNLSELETFGCLIQEAKILFRTGRKTDKLVQRVEALSKKIYENKEIKQNDKECWGLFSPTKGVRAEKVKSWSDSDWSQEVDLLIAEMYISRDRIEEAQEILKDLQKTATFPKIKYEISHLIATILVKQNKEKELYALLKLNEKYDRSLYLFGCYLFQKKKYAEGRTKFVQLLKSCYYNYAYFKQYADFEFQLKCYDTCLPNYQKYLDQVTLLNEHLEKYNELRPGLPKRQILLDAESIANFGYCKMEKQLNQEALDMFELSISINPKSSQNLEYLGKLKINVKEFAEGEVILRKSIELKEGAEAYYLLGLCRQHFKDADDAKKCFLNAERINKDHFLALRSLGEIYQEENEYSLCSSYYDRCRKLDGKDEQTLLGLGFCLWKGENKPLEAEKCFTDCLNSNQGSDKSFQAMLLFYRDTKRLPESEFILKYSKFYEKNILILFHLGEVFFQAAADNDPKHYQTASNFFLKLISQPKSQDTSHEFAIAYLRLSQIDYLDHHFQSSFEYLKKFIQKDADEKRAENKFKGELSYEFQAKFLELKNRMQLGKKRISQTFFQCVKINPLAADSYLYFSLHLLFQNSSAAWKFLGKGLGLIENDSKTISSELVLFLQAMRVVRTGDLEVGIRLLQDCISRFDSNELPNFYLGNIFSKQGNFKEAIKYYKNFIDKTKRLTNESTVLSAEQILECICSLAYAYKQQGNNTEALTQIQNCLNIDPNNSTALRMQSQIYVEEGQFVKAHQSVSNSIRSDDSVASSYYILAVASLKMGNTFSTIKSLEQCNQLNQQYPLIQLKLAAVYTSISRPQIAMKHFLHHLAYNPESTQALCRCSKLLAYFGQFESSQAHIDRLFKVLNKNKLKTNDFINQSAEPNPKKNKSLTCLEDESLYDDKLITLADAYSVLGFLQIKQQNLSAALASYSEALRLKPNDEDILLSIAEIYSGLHNYTEEVAIYQNLLKKNLSRKKTQKYMNNLGNAYMLMRNYREAKKAYKISAYDGEDSANVLANLGASYIALQNYDFALKALDRALSIERNQSESLFLTGLVYEGKADIVNAIKHFERAIKSDQTYIPPYFSLAQIKLSQGKLNESLQLCQVCLSQSPNNLRVLLFLGDLQLRAGDSWAALAVFEQISGIIGSLSEQEKITKQTKEINLKCNLQITHIYRHFHEYEKAITHLDKCLEIEKDHPAYLHELGTVLILNKGDLGYALDLFNQASNDCPENAYYIFSIAEVLHRMHKYDLEIESLTKCLAMKPSFEEKIYNNLALAYQSLHKTDKALDAFQQGLASFPEACQLHFNYGNFLYQLKRLKESAAQYEKCLSRNNCHFGALNNLAKVSLFFKDFQRAADCLNQCMIIRPKKNEMYETKVNALLAKGYYPNQM